MNARTSVIASIIGVGLIVFGAEDLRAETSVPQTPTSRSTGDTSAVSGPGRSAIAVLTRQRGHEELAHSVESSELSRSELAQIQKLLAARGFDPGPADGVWGPRTKVAIGAFQRSLGKEPTGNLSAEQVMALTDDMVLLSRWFRPRTNGARSQPAAASLEGSANAPAAEPAATRELSGASLHASQIRASRLFAGPDDYPPRQFAAYGILAFKTEASNYDRARHLMICQAYVSSIRTFDQVGLPTGSQMVTVWPVTTGAAARELMEMPAQRVCAKAVDQYGSVTAGRALRDAALAGAAPNGHGPYLLAWSPAAAKGAPDAIVLVADLSDVQDYKSALDVMLGWVDDIERDPALWSRGWSVEALRLTVQRWFDKRGSQLLTVVGGL